jgi:MFS transporter, DHA1 family, inner membrane transport protein
MDKHSTHGLVVSERQILLILAAIQFTNIVDFMIMMPMGDILQAQLGIGPQKFGWLVSSYGLAAGLTSFLGVFYLDRLDRKKALLFAYFGFAISTASSAIVPNTSIPELNYYLFIGTRVLTGITGGLLGGFVLSIVGDLVPLERRGRAMGTITIAFSLASILGVPLALTLVDVMDNNWHIPFYFVSALSLPIWWMAFKKIPPLNEHLKHRKEGLDRFDTIRRIFQTREQRNALLFTILLVLGQFTTISFLTPYLISNVGLQQHEVKWIYFVGGIGTVFSGVFIGRLVDKLGRYRVFTIFALLSIIPIYINTHLPVVPLWVVLTIAGFFFIFVNGRMIPANTITSSVVNPEYRAGFMSLNSSAMSIASGSSAALAGAILEKAPNGELMHYERVGYVAIAATLLSLFLVRHLKKIAQTNAGAK